MVLVAKPTAAGFFLFLAATLVCCTKTVPRTSTTVVSAFQPPQQQCRRHTPSRVLQQQKHQRKNEVDEAIELKKENQHNHNHNNPNNEDKIVTEVVLRVPAQNRRLFVLNSLAIVPFVMATTSWVPTLLRVEPADASGGATAGGAYLLSAKKRYYERVKRAVHGFVAVEAALEKNEAESLSRAKVYFSPDTTDAGSWHDLTAAGYLLSNAFRRSSSTAPDSLPAVKKYKAFAKEMDTYQKVLKKKGAVAAVEVYDATVLPALNAWLDEIDLPPAQEL